ncbi:MULTISPECIES: energy-coupling factor transporter transmembrane protein EcfT [unclassified Oceanispirochaeta]|uniref:energy-coupling factor transporter transmembrane component T family protein n=1 Tax=unclassified Oceanispirochaeta TaxID=2635722 RepID=UPI000E0950D1|nr:MULTISPECIES: energy-coupling factor transporter transmembrane component T [unclassified Oceanispirochaeta]MBF9017951.1 energy-coupling factor transporter transmembrane protein EcfT [Oceanispirochaeta sp. M2]NPD74462.1 energy-coupling factor transporter transmembrane protein EcfT [Oceanispirochaeta sp. M1]RDG29671.1 energy-coupling factor transporter transmembrane protein EcfT [Oceanispirochaeta sp. M1]
MKNSEAISSEKIMKQRSKVVHNADQNTRERWDFIGKLDVRTNMLGFFSILVIIFFFNDPLFNLGLLGFLLLISPFSKIDYGKTLKLVKSFIPIFILMIVFAGFTFSSTGFTRAINSTELFRFGSGGILVCSRGGLMIGMTFTIRILAMILATAILSSSITIDDFLLFLDSIHIPYELSLVIIIGLRFIPTMEKKKDLVFQAQLSRGASLSSKGLLGKVKSFMPIMVPLFISSIVMSNNLSYAMLNRGYGLAGSWTHMRDLRYSGRDHALNFILFLFLGGIIYMRFFLHVGVL